MPLLDSVWFSLSVTSFFKNIVQVGLLGEEVTLFETGIADEVSWDSLSSFANPSTLTWYKV